MHISFIPYGERGCVERLLRDMEGQKHLMPMTKGKKKKAAWIPGQIRVLPFGVIEYVCTKENLHTVLRTLNTNNAGEYGITCKKLAYPILRKILKLKKPPKFEADGEVYTWVRNFVNILILGIREDGEITGIYIDDKGWKHEAL